MTNYEKYFATVGHAAETIRLINLFCIKGDCEHCLIYEPCHSPGIDFLEWLQEEAE